MMSLDMTCGEGSGAAGTQGQGLLRKVGERCDLPGSDPLSPYFLIDKDPIFLKIHVF